MQKLTSKDGKIVFYCGWTGNQKLANTKTPIIEVYEGDKHLWTKRFKDLSFVKNEDAIEYAVNEVKNYLAPENQLELA